MKVSELTGTLLDYWVARAEGYTEGADEEGKWWLGGDRGYWRQSEFTPSTDWAQGGPIIERERITPILVRWCDEDHHGQFVTVTDWSGAEATTLGYYGETMLEAAMRAYVDSKFGDDVPVSQA